VKNNNDIVICNMIHNELMTTFTVFDIVAIVGIVGMILAMSLIGLGY